MMIMLNQAIIVKSPKKEFIQMSKPFDADQVPRVGEFICDTLYQDPGEMEIVRVTYYTNFKKNPYCTVDIKPIEIDELKILGLSYIELARKHGWEIQEVYDRLFE